MKNLVTLMMVFCCSISLGMAQLNPMSSVGYATEAPPGYCLSVEEYVVRKIRVNWLVLRPTACT